MDGKKPNYLKGLREIRNGAHLLSLANAYLCEEPFLKKIGASIHAQIEGIQVGISALKKKFPGKFAHDIDTEEILEEIRRISQNLQNPDQTVQEKCTVGELGHELEDRLQKLSSTIGSIRDQVEGAGLTYTKKDSFLNLFGGLRHSGGRAASGLGTLLKVFAGLLVLLAIAVAVLFFTMEKEKDLLGNIAAKKAHIRSQEEIIEELDREKQQLMQEVRAMEKSDLSRQEKLAILELEMEVRALEERRQQAEVQIHTHEAEIDRQEEKIAQMKRKSLIRRLLRR